MFAKQGNKGSSRIHSSISSKNILSKNMKGNQGIGIKREIIVYKYDNLDQKAKDRVLEKLRSELDHPFLEDNLREQTLEDLKNNKIKVIKDFKLGYSLGYSQGDGLRFTGLFEWNGYNVNIEPTTHHYVHNQTVSFEIQDDEGNEAPEIKYNQFKEIYEKITKDAEKTGYDEIEYDQSEESLKEMIDANDWLFLPDGRIAPN